MFSGIYTYSVDQKGRIVMPNRFREEIGSKFVLGGHPRGYLVAASSPELLETKENVRTYVECQIKDPTGRFVIPSALRNFAELGASGEATVVGRGDEVEIWNTKRWERDTRFGSGPTRPQVDDPRPERSYQETFRQTPYTAPKPTPETSSPFSSRQQPGQSGQFGFQNPPQQRPHSAFERVAIQQRTFQGSPYIEVEGPIGVADAQKVAARLESALRSEPRLIFLDVRKVDTIDASLLFSLGPIASDLADHGGRLALISARPDIAHLISMICQSPYIGVLPDLEAVMWWLEDQGWSH